jgi:hypothetical protein
LYTAVGEAVVLSVNGAAILRKNPKPAECLAIKATFQSALPLEAIEMTNPAEAGFADFTAIPTEAMFVTWLAIQANGACAH